VTTPKPQSSLITGNPPRFCCYPNNIYCYCQTVQETKTIRQIPRRCSLVHVGYLLRELFKIIWDTVQTYFLFYFCVRKCTQNIHLHECVIISVLMTCGKVSIGNIVTPCNDVTCGCYLQGRHLLHPLLGEL
jgi:hypothetical protein